MEEKTQQHFRRRQRKQLGRKIREQILKAQENEITEYEVYKKLAELDEDKIHQELLRKIAEDEMRHAKFWGKHTGKLAKPKPLKVIFHKLVARFLGLTFSVKLMEKGEEAAQVNYQKIAEAIPEAKDIEKEESDHEKALLNLLDEEKLKYVGSMVLGVNDALVELTGALAGLTLALQKTNLIAITGLITGIAAALSMGASEYLSTKAEIGNGEKLEKDPFKASIYTGTIYMVTVLLLVLPYYIFTNVFLSLTITLVVAVLIILAFTFYISVAQELPFKKRFFEMAAISLGVAGISFGIGFVVKYFIGIEV